MRKWIVASILLVLMTGCAGKSANDFRVSVGLVSAYDAAVSEFKQGQVMEARTRLLSIQQGHEDFQKAQDFLKNKVEPARLKLLRYYAKKGKKEERRREWAKAEEAYKTAAELSREPQALRRYQKNMNLKARQLRFDTIYKQRKSEDQAWLKWKSAYVPPKGLFGDDKAFTTARQDINNILDKHLEETWKLAEKYKNEDNPELAWLYADAYLRLLLDEKKAQDLKNAMKTAVPKGFRLPKDTRRLAKKKRTKTIKKRSNSTTVQALMDANQWLEARAAAETLRKQGDPKADELLETINHRIKTLAEKAYQDGNLAFRSERIDKAVEFWQRAVDLRPDEQSYVDSLRRGKQIQERLSALK